MHAAMARGDRGTFSRRLAELKEAGSMLLVMGEDARARTAVSAQLLGERDAGRRPVFVLLGRDRSVVDDRLPGAAVDASQVVERGFPRSVAAKGNAPRRKPSAPIERLDALSEALDTAVASAANGGTGSLAPGELRVCLDSLTAAVDGFDRPAVEAFLDDLRATVTGHAGMGHAVLPLAAVPDRYGWLPDAFDAVVETRTVEGDPQERWRLAGGELVTEWFPVDAVEVG